MMLPLRARRPGAAILWLRTDNAERRSGCFHAPGFAELGGDPEAVILGLAPDDVSLLRCAADAARCAGLGVLVAECWGHPRVLDLTAKRRLPLAADNSAVPILLLRLRAEPMPRAPATSWQVRGAPPQRLQAYAQGNAAAAATILRRHPP